MTRKQFVGISSLAGGGVLLPGCEGLRELERRPEGAGVQIVSGVLFLAKYKATPSQRAQARRSGGTIFVRTALKPVAEARLRTAAAKPARRRPPVRGPQADMPPEPSEPSARTPETDRLAIAASYYSVVRKAVGGPVPDSLKLASVPVADVPPDPDLARELLAAAGRTRSVDRMLAVRVTGAGMPAEQQNPGAVTVVSYDTRNLDLADDNAFVLRGSPGIGKTIDLDGRRAAYFE